MIRDRASDFFLAHAKIATTSTRLHSRSPKFPRSNSRRDERSSNAAGHDRARARGCERARETAMIVSIRRQTCAQERVRAVRVGLVVALVHDELRAELGRVASSMSTRSNATRQPPSARIGDRFNGLAW
jgi:hypothetical protein